MKSLLLFSFCIASLIVCVDRGIAQEMTPDGYIGRLGIAIGAGTDLSSRVETHYLPSDSLFARTEFQSWVLATTLVLPLTPKATIMLDVNYNHPGANYYTSPPSGTNPNYKDTGYRLTTMAWFKFYL